MTQVVTPRARKEGKIRTFKVDTEEIVFMKA
jgi:hypothetical protein